MKNQRNQDPTFQMVFWPKTFMPNGILKISVIQSEEFLLKSIRVSALEFAALLATERYKANSFLLLIEKYIFDTSDKDQIS